MNNLEIDNEAINKMNDTEYLNSIPGMVDSILEGINEPIENCIKDEDFEW